MLPMGSYHGRETIGHCSPVERKTSKRLVRKSRRQQSKKVVVDTLSREMADDLRDILKARHDDLIYKSYLLDLEYYGPDYSPGMYGRG